jgi:hypothetical protein
VVTVKTLKRLIPDILASSGAVCIACGAFLIDIIAGLFVTGTLLIASAVIWSKGGDTK